MPTSLPPPGVGARQQMVTSYMHRDDNNMFVVKRNMTAAGSGPVLSGDLVFLEHWATGRNLHSHRIPSVMAKSHYQVSGYGEEGVGDENDLWRLEVEGGAEGAPVRPLLDTVRLRHHHLRCQLTCTAEQLPKEWGYGQMEVSCSPWQRQTTESRGFCHSKWIIDQSINEEEKQVEQPVADIAPGLWGKFVEAHRMMFYSNKQMGTQATREELSMQAPWKWPLMLCSQRFAPQPHKQVVMVGSPAVWWTCLACLVLCPGVLAAALFSARRKADQGPEVKDDPEAISSSRHLWSCSVLLGAWALHYLPFFFMWRILYIHHYFPALYFSCLLTGVLLDHLVRRSILGLPEQLKPVALLSFLVGVFSVLAYVFHLFSPFLYGHSEDEAQLKNSTLHHLHWVKEWDF